MPHLLRASSAAALSAAIAAQTTYPPQEVRNEHLPPEPARSYLVADLDGDGLDDLIAWAYAGGSRLWLNRSNARFADVTAQSLPLGAPTIWLTLDADGDGDVDLIGTDLSVLRNNGRGVFSLASVGSGGFPFVAGDFDRDGDTDILGRRGTALTTYRNDGRGAFTEYAPTELFLSQPQGAIVADFDGDGDLDALVFGRALHVNYGENDGTGRFTWTFRNVISGLAADLDGDGDIDVFSGFTAYINNGAGLFTEEAQQRYPRLDYSAVVNLDVDGDGDQDLALASGELWLNNGRGVFTAVPAPDLARNPLGGLTTARIDGDRHLDLVAAPGQLFLSRGTARFVPLAPVALGAGIKAVQLGDLNGDGDPDVLERIESSALAYRVRLGLPSSSEPLMSSTRPSLVRPSARLRHAPSSSRLIGRRPQCSHRRADDLSPAGSPQRAPAARARQELPGRRSRWRRPRRPDRLGLRTTAAVSSYRWPSPRSGPGCRWAATRRSATSMATATSTCSAASAARRAA
jgi:hypothetical protein